MANAWDGLAKTTLTALQGVFGESATYTPQAGGASKSITVIPSISLAQVIISDDHGQASDRLLSLQVAVGDVPAPQRGDLYVLTSADKAGTWVDIRVDKQNTARWLITVRLQTHDNIAGPGAIEVRT